MKINQKRINYLSKKIDKKYLNKFVKEIRVYGKENLEKLKSLKGKRILYLPNHLSQEDTIFISLILNRQGLMHPAIVAGSNLNRWPTNRLFSEETGAIFVDRKKSLKGNFKEKQEELLKLRKNLEKIVEDKNNFLVFLEGGRSYNGTIMENLKDRYPKEYFRIIKKQNKNPKDYYGCNLAIGYFPHSTEKKYLKIASFFKNKLNLETFYYFIDLSSFLTQPLRKKPIVKINFGKPYPLEEYIEKNGFRELIKFAQREIKILYEEMI